MTDFAKALWLFWSGIPGTDGRPLTAYKTGRVPDGAALPYITFDVVRPASLCGATLEARLWMKNGDAGTQRAALTEKIASMLPYCGVRLDTDGGFMILYPAEKEFLAWEEDGADRDILCCRVRYEAKYYGL